MTTRRATKHLAKVIRDQKVTPVVIDQPHFLFDAAGDLPSFGEHQICATAYEGHLADMKLAEWDFPVQPVRIAPGELQLEPQS
jgi:hypothetical protein